jgi:predicted amidophosphoribosyltransferase
MRWLVFSWRVPGYATNCRPAFEELDPLADWFADRLVEMVQLDGHLPGADIVVRVRFDKIRQKEPSFNQAWPLSKRIAKRLDLTLQGVLLIGKAPHIR